MSDWVELFLTYLSEERRLSPNTLAAYRNDISQFEQYLRSDETDQSREESADRIFGQTTPDRLAGFVLHLRDRRNHSAATIARKVAAVKSFFHFLHDQQLMARNPAAMLDAPEVKKPLPRAISAADVLALLEQAAKRKTPEGLRDRAMLRLLYATGMRVSEMVALDVDDVNLPAERITCTGRHARQRELPLDREAAVALEDYIGAARPAICRRGEPTRALFLNHRGLRLTRQGFWLIMKAMTRESGITAEVTPHTLRHSFAAHRLRDGVDLRTLRELLGHANISTTQIYTQVRIEDEGDARVLATTGSGNVGAGF